MAVRLAVGEEIVLSKTEKPSVVTRAPSGVLVQVTQDTVDTYNRSADGVDKHILRGVEAGTLSASDVRRLEVHSRIYRDIARHYEEALTQ